MKLRTDGNVEFSHSISVEMCADIFTKDLSDDTYARTRRCYAKLYP